MYLIYVFCIIIYYAKQDRKGFRPPNAMKGIGYFQKVKKEFVRIFFEQFYGAIFFRNFLRKFFFGRNFFGENFFWENFFGNIFWEDFLGRIFWEEFFGRNYLVEINALSRFLGNLGEILTQ